MMSPEEWFAYKNEMAEMVKQNVIALGLMIRHALLRAPTNWGSAARKQIYQIAKAATAPRSQEEFLDHGRRKKHGDLQPLPFKLSEEDVEWDRLAANPQELLLHRDDRWREICDKAWRDAVILTLNSLAEAPQSLEKSNFSCFSQLGSEPSLANEHEALRVLDLKVKAFVNQLARASASPKG